MRCRIARPLLPLVMAALLIQATAALAQSAQSAAPAPTVTLYQQLGGYDGVVKFVGLVFPRVAQHPALARLFQGHGQDSQQRQFQMVVELICNRTGGPCVYLGRPMKPVHAGLKITDADWRTFMTLIGDGMKELEYPEPVKRQFGEVWGAFRAEVVDAP